MRGAFAISWLAALLCVCAAAVAQDSSRGDGVDTLAPGQILHPTPTKLFPGDAIAYNWTVTSPNRAPLYFSTHIHIGALTVNLTENVTDESAGRTVADREGLYSLLWENRGNESVTFQYMYATEKARNERTPATWPLAAAAILAAATLRRRG